MSKLGYTALFLAMTAVCAMPQSFNIDLDVEFGSPALGNGPPAPTFGGAASQTGVWNRVGDIIGVPIGLVDISGSTTSVTMLKQGDNPAGTGGFFFPGNTGDFALLLNDAEQVADLGPGGNLTYTFSDVQAGVYDVYTYAVPHSGVALNTPVFVPEALHSNTQIVTGPMPGNAFEYLITHSIHRVDLGASGEFHISITQPPQSAVAMRVNGFQIVMVPEPSSAVSIAFGMAIVLFRFNKSRRRREGITE